MLGYALFGLILGAIINHLANALPARRPPLQSPLCPDCEEESSPIQWIGVLAYLAGKRRCPGCERTIPARVPVVEVFTTLLFAYLWNRYGPSAQLVFFSFYSFVFILTFVTDLEHRLILNVVMYPSVAIALITSFFRPDMTYLQALVGGLAGFVLVLLIYLAGPLFVRVWSRVRGQTTTEVPFGFGDVSLSLFIGLVVGFPGIIFALFIGIFAAGLGAVAFLLSRSLVRGRYRALTAIPYGPFLIVGGLTMMLYGGSIISSYMGAYQ